MLAIAVLWRLAFEGGGTERYALEPPVLKPGPQSGLGVGNSEQRFRELSEQALGESQTVVNVVGG
jgi:hypothetical protein